MDLQRCLIEVPMQSVPVSPPPITMTSFPSAVICSPHSDSSVPSRVIMSLFDFGQELHGEVDALGIAAGHG